MHDHHDHEHHHHHHGDAPAVDPATLDDTQAICPVTGGVVVSKPSQRRLVIAANMTDRPTISAARRAYNCSIKTLKNIPIKPIATEVRDDQLIHNMEHGGIYISYQPSLPKEQVKKLKELLSAPFSDLQFQPRKIVLAPRVENKSPIELSSWRRSEALASYDQQKIKDYITRNLGKSPEPLAR